ncbi:MAG TPA: hypothetical protein VG147_14595 [Solirubrobacteraceae bacterium]|jgi:hypothetical protein|nr:hypothetical protein [Solirubrobacteraceae bacterium]
MSSTSQASGGRAAIAAVIVVLVVFGASFGVRKATAGSTQAAPLPAPVAIPSTPVHVSAIAAPATPPALHRPPHPVATAPASTPTPTSTPTPATTPESTSTPTPSAPAKPAAPSGGKSSGPVLVG